MYSSGKLIWATAAICCLALAAVSNAAGVPPNGVDPGAWLAEQLDMTGGGSGLSQPVASEKEKQTVPEEATGEKKQILELYNQFVQLSRNGKPNEALQLSKTLIQKLEDQVYGSRKDLSFAGLLMHSQTECVQLVLSTGQVIETLIEIFKLRRVCSRTKVCTNSSADLLRQKLLNQLEARGGPIAVLGLNRLDAMDTQKIKKAKRKYMLMLHPDKNQAADEEFRNYLKELFNWMNEASRRLQV